MTLLKHDPSAQMPWANTMLGLVDIPTSSSFLRRNEASTMAGPEGLINHTIMRSLGRVLVTPRVRITPRAFVRLLVGGAALPCFPKGGWCRHGRAICDDQ